MLNQMCRAGAIRMLMWFIIFFGKDRYNIAGSPMAGNPVPDVRKVFGALQAICLPGLQ